MAPSNSPPAESKAGAYKISRRTALRMAGAAALTLPAAHLLAAPLPKISLRVPSPTARQFDWGDHPFTLGVASGAPRADGFVLWTRLAPDPFSAGPTGGVAGGDRGIGYEIADDPNFLRIVQRGLAGAEAAFAHTVHLEVRGLRPGRPYWYRFHRPVGQRDRARHDRARLATPPPCGSAIAPAPTTSRIFSRLSPSGGGSARPGPIPRRLHLRVLGGRHPAPQRWQGGHQSRALSQPLCAIPDGSRSAAPACRRGVASSPGTITRWRTIMPAPNRKAWRRKSSS